MLCLFQSFHSGDFQLRQPNKEEKSRNTFAPGGMGKISLFLLFFCSAISVLAQAPHKLSLYLAPGTCITVKDITLGNNPWSFDLTLKGYWNLPGKFKPTLSVSGDLYLEDDKVGAYLSERRGNTFG